MLIYVLALTAAYFVHTPNISNHGPHAAVIDINGVIEASGSNSAVNINAALRNAFEAESAKGVILRINSPGGSAVESNRIYRELLRLRNKYPQKKVYAVAGDFCASGGYYIAAATDEIYVDDNSLVGSIGVIFSSFGFVETMEKLGVSRRVQTGGENKNMFDPFSPQSEEERTRIDNIVSVIHDNFQEAVRQGRGDRLTAHPDIFSGAIFVGEHNVRLGLADGLGDTGYVARDVIGVDYTISYTPRDWTDEIFSHFSRGVTQVLFQQRLIL